MHVAGVNPGGRPLPISDEIRVSQVYPARNARVADIYVVRRKDLDDRRLGDGEHDVCKPGSVWAHNKIGVFKERHLLPKRMLLRMHCFNFVARQHFINDILVGHSAGSTPLDVYSLGRPRRNLARREKLIA